jgi:hypothetical protein
VDRISKRLDRFLIAEELLLGIGVYRSWVEYPFISDHAPILIQLEMPPRYKVFPFKFNPQWLKDQDFHLLVQTLWNESKYLEEEDKQKRLLWKLKDLKDKTKSWQKLRYNSLLQN